MEAGPRAGLEFCHVDRITTSPVRRALRVREDVVVLRTVGLTIRAGVDLFDVDAGPICRSSEGVDQALCACVGLVVR